MKKWKYFSEAEYIDNGPYSDPQLKFEGKIFNYYRIEDAIYASFKEESEENGIETNDANFEAYCRDNQYMIRELFEMQEERG